MYVKQIVCFANSRRNLGRCIAGKLIASSGEPLWIRPVSGRPTQEISEFECKYQDGTHPSLLDVIRIPLKEPAPQFHQTENHLIDTGYYWVRTGRLRCSDLERFVDESADLWGSGYSSYHGVNDRVPLSSAASVRHSLLLIRPETCSIMVTIEEGPSAPKRPRVRVQFEHQKVAYRLAVTDPEIETKFHSSPVGEYAVPECVMCVSLGEAFHDHFCYKLCAAIITPERTGAN